MTTQTNQVRLTADSAIRYVHDYFAKDGETVHVTCVSSHYDEDDNHFMDVNFDRLGGSELFTVWQQADGSIYGEW